MTARTGRRAERPPAAARPVAATGRGWLVLLVLLVVGSGAALALAGRAGPVPGDAGTTQTVTTPQQRQLVCAGGGEATTSYAGLLPGLGSGSVSVDDRPLDLRPGARARVDGTSRDPVTVTTSGSASRGIFATRASRGGGVTACGAPRASWWFTGAGAGPAHGSTLVVANPGSGPAVVDVSVYDADGQVTGAGLRGISVRSGRSTAVDLADVAPSSGNLAVHVEASRGLVVAALSDTTTDVLDPDAEPVQEWLPDQQVPTRHLVLDGLPPPRGVETASPGPRLPRALADGAGLVLANPGQQAAAVTVRLSGKDGASTPKDVQRQTVPAQSVLTVPLAGAVDEAGTAVVVDADRPVTAGYVVPGVRDLVHAAVGVHWRGPAATALPPAASSTLVLTADSLARGGSDRPARVRIVQRDADGRVVDDRRPSLPARSTKTLALSQDAATVVVTSSGQVTGAVLVRRDDTFSVLALTPVLAALRVPEVRPGS